MIIVLYTFVTLISRIALRLTFLRVDLDPRVATSLVKGISDNVNKKRRCRRKRDSLPYGCNAILTTREDFG